MGLRFSLYALLPLQQEPRAPHDVKFLLRPFHDKSPSPRKRPLYLSPPARERLLPLRRPSRRLRACAGQRRGRSPRNFPSGAPAGRTETGERCGGGEGGGGAHSPRPQGGGGARLSPAPPPSPRQRADCAAPLLSGFPGAALRAPARLGDVTGRAVSGGPCRKREEEGASCAAGSAEEGGREEEGGGAAMAAGYHYRPNGGGGGAALPDPSFLWNVFQR